MLAADAGADGVIAPPVAPPAAPLDVPPDILPEPVEPSVAPLGVVGEGVVDGVVVDGVEEGVAASLAFWPQAPKASKADRPIAANAAGFNADAFMRCPCSDRWK